MSNSPIHNKTIRPGSLNGYSYYYSGRRPAAAAVPKKAGRAKPFHRKSLLVIAVVLVAGFLAYKTSGSEPSKQPAASNQAAPSFQAPPAETAKSVNHCAGNTGKLIKISVSQRHLWACQDAKTVHDTPIITGLRNHPETETPPGNYHVYAKQTNTTLKGSDSRGTWSYPVHYWMPFLDNQYGTYGFHDATWRAADEFGNVSPDSEEASHGCIELPLNSSKWLYNWAPVRTTVTVES